MHALDKRGRVAETAEHKRDALLLAQRQLLRAEVRILDDPGDEVDRVRGEPRPVAAGLRLGVGQSA